MKGKNFEKSSTIKDKVVIITGGDRGIGRQTAIDLAKRGGKIYITCSDEQSGIAAVKSIKSHSCQTNIYFLELNLKSFDSIRKFSRNFHDLEEKLHILINNEDRFCVKKSETDDGFETHFGVNYLGHFLLTNLLFDLMRAAPSARVIMRSSIFHYFGHFEPDNLIFEDTYNRFKAYANSMLANNLFVHEFSKKMTGTSVTANSFHPGFVVPKMSTNRIWRIILETPFKFVFKTSKEGAQTTICLAVDSDLKKVSGKLFIDCSTAKTSENSTNDMLSQWLWKKSEHLVGLANV